MVGSHTNPPVVVSLPPLLIVNELVQFNPYPNVMPLCYQTQIIKRQIGATLGTASTHSTGGIKHPPLGVL